MSINTLMEWLEVVFVVLSAIVLAAGGLFIAFLVAVTKSNTNTPQVPTPSSRSKEEEEYENLKGSLERKRSFWLPRFHDSEGRFISDIPRKKDLSL